MADYNPNTVSAYQQYASSMSSGGGGSNMSGLGAKSSSSGRMSSRFDTKGYTPTTSKSTASGVAYQTEYGDDSANIPMTSDQIYSAAANAATEAGSIFTPQGPTANAMNLYSMPNMVESVSDYVYRADRDEAITSAISGVQAEEQEQINAAISSVNKAITQGKTDAEIAEAFLNDMGGFGNDKPDETGGFGVPGVTLKDVTDTQQGLMTNPQPLYDFAEEMRNPSITTTELPPMSPEEQASLGAAIRKAAEEGTLQSKLTSIQFVRSDGGDRTDPSWWDNLLFGEPDGITEEEEVVDVSPTAEAADQQGLMSRPAPAPETPAVNAVATDENFLETPTFKLLEGVEGFESKPYSLNNRETLGGKPHKSGLTVGAGIDFGQHSEQTLLDMGVPKTMVDKAKDAGWIGLNPDTIVDPKTGEAAATRSRGHKLMYDKFLEQKKAGTLPTFTEAELSQATPPVYQEYEDAARTQFENDTGLDFDDLNEGSKAVLTLEKYHRGVNYTLPEAMLIGAAENNPDKAAAGIKNPTRRKNVKAWVKKVGLGYETRRETSPRPMLRPTE